MSVKNDTSVVERIRSEIEKAILDGALAAGQRLTEAALTKRLDVSRGPLREALHLLESDGLITIQAHKGAVVRKLSRQDFSEFFQLRSLFESFAAGRCAKRIDEPGVREAFLPLYQEAQAIAAGSERRPFSEHDADMHDTILRMCNNQMLIEHWRRIRLVPLFRYRFLSSIKPADLRQSAAEHVDILGAILAGNEAQAEAASRAHVARINGIVQSIDAATFDQLFHFRKG